MADPLTLRYNNPGALEYGPFAQRYGATSDGRYAIFPDMDTGYQAMGGLLDTYQNKHGLNTVRGIIERWAPRSADNNSTDAYIRKVAQGIGVQPDEPLKPEHRPALMREMASYEAGRPMVPPSSAPAATASLGGSPSAPSSPGRSPMADPYTPSPDEMVTPEDVAARRKYGSMLLEQALSGGNPRTGWGAIGNLALGLVGGGLIPDSARKAELAGQMASSRALQEALRSDNPQEALAKGLSTPYGRQMLAGIADKVLAGNIQEKSPRGQLELEQLRLQNEALKRKDWLGDAIAREMGITVPAGPPAAAAPVAPPSPPSPASAPTTLTDVPGTVVAPPGAPVTTGSTAPTPSPAALPGGKTLRQLFAERTPAERLEFLMAYQKDPAKASEIINKWANPLNAAEQARQKEVGEAQGKAQADLPRIEANVQRVLKQIDEVSGDKNLPNVTGWNAKTPTIRPTSIATENRIKQLGGAAFLEMYNALRGGGAITEAEGAKATAALARLDTHQDTKSFRAALKDFRDEVINLREVARQRAQTVGTPAVGSQAAGATIPPPASPKPTTTAEGGMPRISSDAEFDALPSGQKIKFIDPNGVVRVKP